MLPQKDLELALLDPEVEKVEANHSENPNGSRRAHRRKNRHS
jgi:hypothetical protein